MKLIINQLVRSVSIVDGGVIVGIVYFGAEKDREKFIDWFEQAQEALKPRKEVNDPWYKD